jgi:2-keto-4-pentenoate hydratase/2-oxohepta-3-ene-1,7-dioic acid hydratase in catechol pathway
VTFTYASPAGVPSRLGALTEAGVVDLNHAARALVEQRHGGLRSRELADALVPADALAFLETGQLALDTAREALGAAASGAVPADGARVVWPHAEVSLRAPLRPRTLREFSVFEGHLAAVMGTLPEVWYRMPIYWKGNPNAVFGPEDTLPWPAYSDRLDFELEIAAVIGTAGTNIAPGRALEHVAGFTIFNDVSARDIQFREMQFSLGPAKGKDFCNVFGPALVTPDELDPHALRVEVRVNGERWAEHVTSDMQHDWPALISHVSQDEQLLPGDVLVSGTVTGCSATEYLKRPQGPLMREGDVVEFEVDGIGVLRNVYGTKPDRPSIDY